MSLCDVRYCERAAEHTTLDTDDDLAIKEQINLCAHHARLLCDFEDLDDSMTEAGQEGVTSDGDI